MKKILLAVVLVLAVGAFLAYPEIKFQIFKSTVEKQLKAFDERANQNRNIELTSSYKRIHSLDGRYYIDGLTYKISKPHEVTISMDKTSIDEDSVDFDGGVVDGTGRVEGISIKAPNVDITAEKLEMQGLTIDAEAKQSTIKKLVLMPMTVQEEDDEPVTLDSFEMNEISYLEKGPKGGPHFSFKSANAANPVMSFTSGALVQDMEAGAGNAAFRPNVFTWEGFKIFSPELKFSVGFSEIKAVTVKEGNGYVQSGSMKELKIDLSQVEDKDIKEGLEELGLEDVLVFRGSSEVYLDIHKKLLDVRHFTFGGDDLFKIKMGWVIGNPKWDMEKWDGQQLTETLDDLYVVGGSLRYDDHSLFNKVIRFVAQLDGKTEDQYKQELLAQVRPMAKSMPQAAKALEDFIIKPESLCFSFENQKKLNVKALEKIPPALWVMLFNPKLTSCK